MSDEILTIKKENVLAAAKECSDADMVLRKIFPDAFEEKDEYCEPKDLKTEIRTKGDGLFFVITEGRRNLTSSQTCMEMDNRIFIPFFKDDGIELDGGNFKIKKLSK